MTPPFLLLVGTERSSILPFGLHLKACAKQRPYLISFSFFFEPFHVIYSIFHTQLDYGCKDSGKEVNVQSHSNESVLQKYLLPHFPLPELKEICDSALFGINLLCKGCSAH